MKKVLGLLLILTIAPLRAEEDEELVENRTVKTSDGIEIHCLERGEGRAILFIPGWTMPAEVWAPQINYFAQTYRVVAMDPRDQGDSSQTHDGLDPATRAGDIKAVIDQLKLAPVVLVGWSSAVTEIASYVKQFGSKSVRGFVLVDGVAGADLPPGMKPEDLPFLAMMRKDRANFAEQLARSLFKKPQSDLYMKKLIAATMKTPTDDAVALSVASVKADNRPALNLIDKPTLICAATIPQSARQDMKERIKGAQLEVFENAGHGLFVDEVVRFNAVLDEFLKEKAY